MDPQNPPQTPKLFHRVLIISKAGIPLFYRSKDPANEEFIPLSAFFGGILNFSKGFKDIIKEINFSQLKYLLYASNKFVIILGVNTESAYEDWTDELIQLEQSFQEKFDPMLNEIGQFVGKLSAFDIFEQDYENILPFSKSCNSTESLNYVTLNPVHPSFAFKEFFIA